MSKRNNHYWLMDGLFFLLALTTFSFYYHCQIFSSLLAASGLLIGYLALKIADSNRFVFLFASLIAIYWSFSTKVQSIELTAKFTVSFILAALMYTLLFSRLISACLSVKRRIYSDRMTVIFSSLSFLGIFGSWFFYWLAFYPGLLTNDSYSQWAQANGYQVFSEWHPVIHTLLIKLFNQIYHSPASFLFVQLLFGAIVVVFVLTRLLKRGTPLWMCVAGSLFYALYPINGFFMTTLWKDIPYTILLLLFFYLVSGLIMEGTRLANRWPYLCSLILVAAATALFRKNGLYVVVVTLVFLVFYVKSKKLLLSSIAAGCLIFTFNVYTAHQLKAEKSPTYEALAIPLQQVSATYKMAGNLPTEEKKYFDQILPTKLWKQNYSDKTVDYIKFDPHFNGELIERQPKLFLVHWFELLQHNPKIFIRSFLQQTACIWRFATPNDYKITIHGLEITGSRENYYLENQKDPIETNKKLKRDCQGYQLRAKINQVVPISFEQYKKKVLFAAKPLVNDTKTVWGQQKLQVLYQLIDEHYQKYIVRGAVAVLLLLLTTAISFIKYGLLKTIGLLLVPYLNLASLLVSVPATDFRYIYSLYFSSWVIFLLILAGNYFKETTHE